MGGKDYALLQTAAECAEQADDEEGCVEGGKRRGGGQVKYDSGDWAAVMDASLALGSR